MRALIDQQNVIAALHGDLRPAAEVPLRAALVAVHHDLHRCARPAGVVFPVQVQPVVGSDPYVLIWEREHGPDHLRHRFPIGGMRQWVNGRRNDCDRPCRCSAHFCFLLACRARCLACSFISGVQLSALERSFHRLTILEPSSSQNTITLFSSALISVILFLTDFALSLSMLNTSSVRATSFRLAQSEQAISSSLFNLNTSQMSLIRS